MGLRPVCLVLALCAEQLTGRHAFETIFADVPVALPAFARLISHFVADVASDLACGLADKNMRHVFWWDEKECASM